MLLRYYIENKTFKFLRVSLYKKDILKILQYLESLIFVKIFNVLRYYPRYEIIISQQLLHTSDIEIISK